MGGIAVIRVSGPDSINIVSNAWIGKDLASSPSHTLHFGKYRSIEGSVLDEAVSSIFRSPASFTGENVVEISIHGSTWIQKEVLNDLIKRGVRIAQPGEFTQRAFLNGKLDLAQAEGVADLIASSSKAAHAMAINQIKGSFSSEFEALRKKLIDFASLLELELDFSEEDVEFADRSSLLLLCDEILDKVNKLAHSFSYGNVLKNGVPVVIAGLPNAGKSSLLNLLLNDDKAIVTEIPGTTRDIIEDTAEIDGILYRFIDTAGLRHTSDVVEGIGVKRALSALRKAFIVVWVIDITLPLSEQIEPLIKFSQENPDKKLIILFNKNDLAKEEHDIEIRKQFQKDYPLLNEKVILFSTHSKQGLDSLLEQLRKEVAQDINPEKDIIVTNARHYEALIRAAASLSRVKEGLINGISGDFIAQDIRESISYLATITGEITTDNLLHSIFSRFCIGK